MRLKDLTKINTSTLPEGTLPDYTFRYIDISSVSSEGAINLGDETQFYEAPSRARRIVKKGDVLISTVRTYLKAIAPINFESHDVIASTGFAVCSPIKGTSSKYLAYAVRTNDVIDEICKESSGVSYPAISATRLSSVSIPYRQQNEQEFIASYLDEKTAAIDERISILEKKSDAYARLRASLIQSVVTKGLNKNVELKDSDIDWIGSVPKHWGEYLFKNCVTIQNGKDYKTIETEEGIPVIGSGGQFAYASQYMYDGEVIFLGRKGTIDKPLYYCGKFWAVDTMFYAIPKRKMYGKYLYYYTLCFPFNKIMTQTALPSMTQTALNSINLCIPAFEEQQSIARYLDQKCADIDSNITNVNNQIEALKTLKKALINEVITGKRAI